MWMMDEAELAQCKKGATIINTARGKVIRESALARAIASGHIKGAALDVFEDEPLPMDSPLRQLGDKVLLSPHSASYNIGGELRLPRVLVEHQVGGPGAPALLLLM
jgi:phosphoglycerate dehydrogenase-like enzyme